MYNHIQKLASAIHNDVMGGLKGYHHNLSMSMEQLEDDIVDTRLQILKEYSLKGILPTKDLYITINCIPVDCKNIERCRCMNQDDCFSTPTAHFEIPQILLDYGQNSIDYLGSVDRQVPFVYYTSLSNYTNHKYRKRGKNKPCVWIDTTPNENGMYDCFVFNTPMLEMVSITAIFKDIRQLENFKCCTALQDNNISFIDNEIKNRLVAKKLQFYRQFAAPLKPNDQQYN